MESTYQFLAVCWALTILLDLSRDQLQDILVLAQGSQA